MPRYTDADALMDWIIEADPDWCVNPVRNIFDHIEELPPADVAEVKHGRWIENKEIGGYFCSKCGRETEDRHDEPITMGKAKGYVLVLPYYCGFCGAKMDKEGGAE